MRTLVLPCGLLLLATLTGRAGAAEWQWSVTIDSITSNETKDHPRAFLWIPPNCNRVRGVVVGQHNMEEEPILEDPVFRGAMRELGFAEVWVTPGFDLLFRFDRGAGEAFDQMMSALADASGYDELTRVPVVPIGHSAAASFPWNFAAWKPQRTLCAVSVSGQWPIYKDANTPDWGDRTIDGVPGLVTMGEYEWAGDRSLDGAKQRAEHPKIPMSMLGCPADGHFAPTDEKISFIAQYIRKAAAYRLASDGSVKPIDPTTSGWFVDRYRKDTPAAVPAAPVAEYKGDPKEAFWFFDEQIARAAESFGAQHRGKKSPLLGYLQDGKVVEQNPKLHEQVPLKFLPDPAGDGLTFKLTGTFLETVPKGRPERWTGKPEGSPVDRPDRATNEHITISRICGPIEQLAPDTFAIRSYRMGMNNPKRSNDVWLVATYPGNGEFKRMQQQASMRFPLKNERGVDQQISFPEIPNQPVGTKSIPLKGTSSAGATVHYYVREGPAEVDGDRLVFTSIPPRAAIPMKVTVVAWQWGRSIESKLKTAEPVERTFSLVKSDAPPPAPTKPFVHPGILHTRDDIDRMKRVVAEGAEPWKGGFEVLKAHEDSHADYKMRGPFETAGRGPGFNDHIDAIMHDCNAAYQNALMWAITGDEAHARKSVEILNAWSRVHRKQTGRDVQLGAGLWGFKFVSAAEILRYTYPKWERGDVKGAEGMFREVFYPPIKDFATFANGNWDGACIKTIMAIGVFCDDREIFDRGVDYFYNGRGNGRISHYVLNDAGQCQESGRDQPHTMLGLGLLAEACEISWNQGIDMYGAADNRLLKGFEYTARYNLGEDVPFVETTDTTGKYHHTKISDNGRGKFRPVWELPYNHYVNRRGLEMPYSRRVVEKTRPEGAAWTSDHPGFGTVLFTLPRGPTSQPGK